MGGKMQIMCQCYPQVGDVRIDLDKAIESGADFICVGMFDYQIVEDVNIAIDVLADWRIGSGPGWREGKCGAEGLPSRQLGA